MATSSPQCADPVPPTPNVKLVVQPLRENIPRREKLTKIKHYIRNRTASVVTSTAGMETSDHVLLRVQFFGEI